MSKHDHGKLASQWEVDHNDYDTADYIVFHEDDPVSTDGQNRWQKGIDDWQNTEHKDDKMYHPPDDLLNFNKDTPTPTGNVQGAEATPTDSPTPTP